MYTPEERIQILRAETARLEAFLGGLSPEDWNRPSTCEQWTVADVVAHLTGHNQNYPNRIIRALQGDASPDTLAHHRLNSGQMDPRATGDRAIALTQKLGDQLLSEFIKGNQVMDHALAKVGPQDWDKLVYRPVGTESLRNIVDVFITERTIHGWDIRSRFDPQSRLSPECVPIIVGRIPQRPRWWAFETEPGFSPLPLRYRFKITSPLPYAVDVVVTKKQQYMEIRNNEPAQVTFQCDGETFVFLMYGRTTAATAMADGRLSFEGDSTLATAFAERFKGG